MKRMNGVVDGVDDRRDDERDDDYDYDYDYDYDDGRDNDGRHGVYRTIDKGVRPGGGGGKT